MASSFATSSIASTSSSSSATSTSSAFLSSSGRRRATAVVRGRGRGRGGQGQRQRGKNAPADGQRARVVCRVGAGDKPKVIVAGGGIGGLVTALSLQNKGLEVVCFERVRKYKPWGGPIQMAGNAMAALQAIDPELAAEVVTNGTVTGDRLNGLLDGKDGEWFVRFDTRKPSVRCDLPLTIVMSRFDLINRLTRVLNEKNPDVLKTGLEVMSYEELDGGGVRVTLSDGSTEEGDLLVGADGIRSRVRSQFFGNPPLEFNLDKPPAGVKDAPTYCGYTCYAAISKMTPADVEEVGYTVYLGAGQYFVASDVGDGQQQWYAFVKQDPGMEDEGVDRKAVLLEAFKDWCPAVVDRLEAVVSEEVERRDIYDRPPTLAWANNNVALLGDAAHAMQPNMGQGGCQAIEDAAALADCVAETSPGMLWWALHMYQFKRIGRASAITGFAAMASIMTSTYRRYLGSNPYAFYGNIPGGMEFWAAVEKLKIPHPGRIIGQIAMLSSIDLILMYIVTFGQRDQELTKALFDSQKGDMRTLPDDIFEAKGIWGFAK